MIFKTHRQSKIDIMDDDLACLRLWRKPIAKDDCSLYRAVSEQLFLSQVYHEEIRDKVTAFIEKNHEKLKSEWTTRIEFLAISLLFHCDIIVYQFGRAPIDLTVNHFDKKVHLCVSGGNHYDCVYPYSYKETGAICQSLLYDILYRRVFKVGDDVIKEGLDILHCKQYHRSKKFADRGIHGSPQNGPGDHTSSRFSPRDLPPHPPFPYRVAKALDPVIYRNVEYDNWVDSVKDSAADLEPTFQTGDKCQVILEREADKVYYAHIQDMSPGKGPVTVFIEELGEKHTVDYESLLHVPKPHQYDSRKKGKKKDQFFLPFSRSGVVLGMNVSDQDMDDEIRSPSSPESQKPVYSENSWGHGTRPRQYLNSMGHPVKVRWNGVTVKYPHNKGFHKHNQQGNNANTHSHRDNRFGGHRNFNRNHCGGYHQEKVMTPHHPGPQQDFQTPIQENVVQTQRLEGVPTKEEFLDHTSVVQNMGYHPVESVSTMPMNSPLPPFMPAPNGTPMTPNFSSQLLPPPPLSMSAPPPQTYSTSPVSYPLSMYPYLVLPPVGMSSNPVNLTAGPSQDPSGNDLPISDPSTLRYFYNLGYECHRLTNIHLGQCAQGPIPACLPPYPSSPMMIQGAPCPPPEEYWTAECSEVEMPPGVILQNDMNERSEIPACPPDFLLSPPPPYPGTFQPIPPTTNIRMPFSSSVPISIPVPPPVNGPPLLYPPSSVPQFQVFQAC